MKKIAIKSCANGQYVSANGNNEPLIANKANIQASTTFDMIHLDYPKFNLRSHSNGLYIGAMGGGGGQLKACSMAASGWETFQLYPLEDGVCIKSSANGKFISAEDVGKKPLIVNREKAEWWEKFYIVPI